MTEAKLRALFDLWQKRLGLSTWKIEIELAVCERECHDLVLMETHRSGVYETATIRVQPWALTGNVPEEGPTQPLTDRYLETKVVHELLHCSMRDLRFADDMIVEELRPDFNRAWQIVQRKAEESVVDKLATALVKSFGQKGKGK